MKAVGEMLREERKRQGMSIDDVMSRTKVSRRHIEALEDGNIADLPHPVYVKGFLKVYAGLLGLEYKKLLPVVDDAYASLGLDPAETEPHARPSENISLNPPQRAGLVRRVLLLLFFVALLGGTGYFVYDYFFAKQTPPTASITLEKQENTTAPEQSAVQENEIPVTREGVTGGEEPLAESIMETQPPVPAEDGGVEVPQQEEAPESSMQEEQDKPVEAETEAEISQLADRMVQEAEKPAEDTSSHGSGAPSSPNIVIIPETARQAPSENIKILQVIAKGQCWIEAKVDAELTTDFYVRQGERVDIKFQENLAVKFGNIGEVSLRYNGKPYTTSVPTNGVKTLIFPPPSS